MAKVGCAGILVADTFCGPLAQMPREGQLVTLDEFPAKAGGCAANVAINLAKQGIEVDVAGCVGKDTAARIILESFDDHGVRYDSLVYSDNNPTSQTIIVLIEGEDRRYLHCFGANKDFRAEHMTQQWLSRLDVFYLGGLFVLPGMTTDGLLEVLKFCRKNGVVTVLDVVIPDQFSQLSDLERLLPYVDYFLPNDDEAAQLTGHTAPLDQLRTLQAQGVGAVIITQGQDGAIAAQGNEFWQVGKFTMDVVDPSGSGDAFASGVIAGICRKFDWPDLLKYASAIGASAVRGVGTTTSVMTADEADAFIAVNELQLSAGKIEILNQRIER